MSDNGAVSYVITATPEGSEEEILLYEGEGAVEEGVLGGIDPTLLANGSYTIAVTAFDEAGNVRMGSATCQVDCPLKVGNNTRNIFDSVGNVVGTLHGGGNQIYIPIIETEWFQ